MPRVNEFQIETRGLQRITTKDFYPSLQAYTVPKKERVVAGLNRTGFSSAFYRRMKPSRVSIRSSFGSGLFSWRWESLPKHESKFAAVKKGREQAEDFSPSGPPLDRSV